MTAKIIHIEGKNMRWVLRKNMITLMIELDWPKYINSGRWNLKLPPSTVGVCNSWRNVISKDGKLSRFTMTWNRSKIDHIALDAFTLRIQNYATISSLSQKERE